MEFIRPHHRVIAKALKSFDAKLLAGSDCFFGGGTAIALKCQEHRESVDIDFLCSSAEGYKALTMAVWGRGLSGLLLPDELRQTAIEEVRDLRRDRDKMVCVMGVEFEGNVVPIKLEIVREGRIHLKGEMDRDLGVPVLSIEHMYAEKILANTDRGNDKSTLSRDIIDLSILQLHFGPIPDSSWVIAEEAYGPPAREAYENSVKRIRERDWLSNCARKMSMSDDLINRILDLHGGEISPTPSPFDD